MTSKIRVGDCIQPKNIPNCPFEAIQGRAKWPLLVRKISICDSRYDSLACRGCPGEINNEQCYGYTEGFCVERVRGDWDE